MKKQKLPLITFKDAMIIGSILIGMLLIIELIYVMVTGGDIPDRPFYID